MYFPFSQKLPTRCEVLKPKASGQTPVLLEDPSLEASGKNSTLRAKLTETHCTPEHAEKGTVASHSNFGEPMQPPNPIESPNRKRRGQQSQWQRRRAVEPPIVWAPDLESIYTQHIPSKNKGPYFKPHPNKEETCKGPN